MTFHKHILIKTLTVGVICIFGTSLAYSQTPKKYTQQFSQLTNMEKQIDHKHQEITQIQQTLQTHGTDIAQLKSKEKPSFLQQLPLQKQMQEAQTLSIELNQKYKEKTLLENQFIHLQKQLNSDLENYLSKNNSTDQTQTLMNLQKRVASMKIDQEQKLPLLTHFVFQINDSESAQEQYLVLQDLSLHTQKLIEETQQELRHEKQQRLLRRELSHLMNEEVFFGEQGFIQSAARKQNGSNTTHAATADQNEKIEGDQPQAPGDTEIDLETDSGIETDQDFGQSGLPEDLTSTTPETAEMDTEQMSTDFMDQALSQTTEELPIVESPIEIINQDTLATSDINGEFSRDDWPVNQDYIHQPLLTLEPILGESKQAFLKRKLEHLKEVLTSLKQTSNEIKPFIEKE